MNRIEIIELTKKIKNHVVLSDINLSLKGGRIYGLVGKNGSGKTMLIRTISGLVKPTSGEIIYNDKRLYNDIDFIDKLGIVIENISLYPHLTGFENLKKLAGINNLIDDEKIRKTISKIGLDPYDNRKVSQYSLGMKQKIVLAQAFMEDPEVLLLDEPTNGLDTDSVELMYRMCRERTDAGAIVIISTHSEHVIENIIDVLIKIEDGRAKVQ